MNWLVYHVASGQSFYSGLLLILAAALLSIRSVKYARRVSAVVMCLGVIAVGISSTPIPYWTYGLLATTLAVWSLVRSTERQRKLATAAVCGACLFCAALEAPYSAIPRLTTTADLTVTIVGDSVTAGMGEPGEVIWPTLLQQQHDIAVHDVSHVGETAASALRRVRQHSLQSPIVLVEIGGNDILGSTTTGEFARDLDALLSHLVAPGRQVAMFELPLPPFYHEFGRIQRDAARRHGVKLIPKRIFLSLLAGEGATLDSIHLSEAGHARMAELVWGLIGPAFPGRAEAVTYPTVSANPKLQFVSFADESAADKAAAAKTKVQRYLYVATPGVRDYLEYGGHGLLVFDIDDGHKFVKRIPTGGLRANGTPLNVKGICAHAGTQRIYISTLESLLSIDLVDEKLLWERQYAGGCDRMALSPDGRIMYLPTLEKDDWHVIDAGAGDVIATISPKSKSHNTVYGPDGKWCYLAGLGSPLLSVADTSTHSVAKTVGPFSNMIRPFTVNGRQTRCYVCLNELLGFEVGDIESGRKMHRVEVQGFQAGPVKRHGCPSHGIGLTPDESEVWVVDGHNRQVHIFDNTVVPPRQLQSIELRDEPGWVTFSLDGTLAWPSTGDVIEVKSRQIITRLTDEAGRPVMSEKLLEIDFADGKPIRAGNQFGVGANY